MTAKEFSERNEKVNSLLAEVKALMSQIHERAKLLPTFKEEGMIALGDPDMVNLIWVETAMNIVREKQSEVHEILYSIEIALGRVN